LPMANVLFGSKLSSRDPARIWILVEVANRPILMLDGSLEGLVVEFTMGKLTWGRIA
jgi:hypothetical protein